MVLWHLEVENQKPADIAPLLGMSANSVSALAYRAREGLRQAFLNMHTGDLLSDACRETNDLLGGYVRHAACPAATRPRSRTTSTTAVAARPSTSSSPRSTPRWPGCSVRCCSVGRPPATSVAVPCSVPPEPAPAPVRWRGRPDPRRGAVQPPRHRAATVTAVGVASIAAIAIVNQGPNEQPSRRRAAQPGRRRALREPDSVSGTSTGPERPVDRRHPRRGDQPHPHGRRDHPRRDRPLRRRHGHAPTTGPRPPATAPATGRNGNGGNGNGNGGTGNGNGNGNGGNGNGNGNGNGRARTPTPAREPHARATRRRLTEPTPTEPTPTEPTDPPDPDRRRRARRLRRLQRLGPLPRQRPGERCPRGRQRDPACLGLGRRPAQPQRRQLPAHRGTPTRAPRRRPAPASASASATRRARRCTSR